MGVVDADVDGDDGPARRCAVAALWCCDVDCCAGAAGVLALWAACSARLPPVTTIADRRLRCITPDRCDVLKNERND